MIPAERREEIVRLVEKNGVLSIGELKNQLKVSEITIRRDLKILCDDSRIKQVFGGVSACNICTSEPKRDYFESRAIQQKTAIAREAVRMIPENTCIYLDAGTTTYAIAQLLEKHDDLTVITNDISIADLLIKKSQCKLILTGGTVDRGSRACIGNAASQELLNYNIEIAFVSAPSWDQRGIMTSSEDKVAVKRSLVKCARKLVLVADSLKYNLAATYLALPLAKFHTVITDSGLSNENATMVRETCGTLLLAGITN